MSVALHEIISRTKAAMKLCKANLEIEGSAKILGQTQGKLAGYKKLISWICAEYSMTEFEIRNIPSETLNTPDMSDSELFEMKLSADNLRELPAWGRLVERRQENTEILKLNLIIDDTATSRDLYLANGQYMATMSPEDFFNDIDRAVEIRKQNQERQQKEPDLPFDGEDKKVVNFNTF